MWPEYSEESDGSLLAEGRKTNLLPMTLVGVD